MDYQRQIARLDTFDWTIRATAEWNAAERERRAQHRRNLRAAGLH